MLTAVTGINWGDEGKGRVIDLLAEHADVVARYQGGNNAGHTVVTEQGKFILNLLPSGRPTTRFAYCTGTCCPPASCTRTLSVYWVRAW